MESPGAAPAGCSPASAIPQQINNFFTFIKNAIGNFINQSTTGSANSGFISIAAFGIGKYL